MKKQLLTLSFCIFSVLLFAQVPTKIFTSDIDNFWIAYDSVHTTTDTLKQAEFIQHLYLNKATDGLKDFMVARQHTAKRHLKNILRYPKFWVSLKSHTLQIKHQAIEIENAMLRFKKLYGNFKRPGIYFTIGCLNSGGTTSDDKILIGAEIAASDSTVDASELGAWLQGVFKNNKDVIYLVCHESGHTQQKQDAGDSTSTLLGFCIREGACDFIAELLLQKPVTMPYIIYGKANEGALWKKFQTEMYGQETKNWLYNGNDAPGGNADLGYFMGYTICKAYYKNAKNKEQALKDIIELEYKKENVVAFLLK